MHICGECVFLLAPPILSFFPSHFRYQGMLQDVYSKRAQLKKEMADLDAAERDILLRTFRKVTFCVRMCCIERAVTMLTCTSYA